MSILKYGDAADQPHPQAFFRSEFKGKMCGEESTPMDEASC